MRAVTVLSKAAAMALRTSAVRLPDARHERPTDRK